MTCRGGQNLVENRIERNADYSWRTRLISEVRKNRVQ
jgi:hypothetical protein